VVLCVVACAHDRSGELHHCNHVNHFFHTRGHMTLIRPEARRLGAGAPLTVLQFAQLFGSVRVLGLNMDLERVLGSFNKGAFWRTSFSKLEGGKWKEAYLPHFLAD
jgi:hypothetical protein